TVGYVGADSWTNTQAENCDILAVVKDINRSGGAGTSDAARPTADRVLNNGLNGEIDPSTGLALNRDGWQIGGRAILATIGNPFLTVSAAEGGYGWAGKGTYVNASQSAENTLRTQFTDPNASMDYAQGAKYILNIARSIEAFNASSGNPANQFSPG